MITIFYFLCNEHQNSIFLWNFYIWHLWNIWEEFNIANFLWQHFFILRQVTVISFLSHLYKLPVISHLVFNFFETLSHDDKRSAEECLISTDENFDWCHETQIWDLYSVKVYLRDLSFQLLLIVPWWIIKKLVCFIVLEDCNGSLHHHVLYYSKIEYLFSILLCQERPIGGQLPKNRFMRRLWRYFSRINCISSIKWANSISIRVVSSLCIVVVLEFLRISLNPVPMAW